MSTKKLGPTVTFWAPIDTRGSNMCSFNLKLPILAVVSSVLLASLFLFIDFGHFVWRKHIFEKIELGSPATHAEERLRESDIYCESSLTGSDCRFDDFWEVYSIHISKQGIVTHKQFAYKPQTHSLIVKLLRHIGTR